MMQFCGQAGGVRHLQFTPDGRHLTVACDDSTGIEFWDTTSGERAWVVPPNTRIAWYVLHPAGRWAYADANRRWGELALVDLTTGKEVGLRCVPFHGLGVDTSPDGARVIASTRTDLFPRSKTPARGDTQNWLMCWRHARGGRPTLEWEWGRTVREPITYRVAFFPAGIASPPTSPGTGGPSKGHVSQLAVRDAASGKYIQVAGCEGAEVVLVSPDGQRVVTRWGGKLQVWEASDLTIGPTTVTDGPDPGWYAARFEGVSAAFHPSGKYLAATTNDADVRLYDTASWGVARTFDWGIGRTRSIAFSPDGTRAAVGYDSGMVVIWDLDV